MQVMHDVELETPPAAASPGRRRRCGGWWRWALVALLVVVAVFAIVYWWLTRPPAPVSVSDVVDRYRSSSPAPTSVTGGPAAGVYVYATKGSERISAGVTHHYPARTTLTVTKTSCGLDARWEALSGRWSSWQLCKTGAGWRLVHYVDVHKFLYMKDVKDYTCTGFPEVVCRTADGVLTSTLAVVGADRRTVDGAQVRTTHLRIAQSATGKSESTGTVDLWVLPSGLPAALEITDHGSSVVLGSHIDYDETAEFTLTSTTPRR